MVRHSSLLGIALLALIPAEARADVTATYQRPGAAGTLTVEVTSSGNVRAGNDQSGYYLWTQDQGYEVSPGPGGPSVIRTADTAAARAGARPSSEIMQPWLPVDTVLINRWTGIRYFIGGARHNPGAVPLVISQDPSLAALASGYRRFTAMQETPLPKTPRVVVIQISLGRFTGNWWQRRNTPRPNMGLGSFPRQVKCIARGAIV